MSSFSPLLSDLIEAFQALPGVGRKTAQRMTFQLLERHRDRAKHLGEVLLKAANEIRRCEQCRTLSETAICQICANPARNRQKLCIVESPADVAVIEEATGFRGLYYVLMGRLSPLDGIGPAELGLDELAQRLDADQVQEVILATNMTVEGEATAHYIFEICRAKQINVTKIAQGVPMGGELEYLDNFTLSHAFDQRRQINGLGE